jgi:hypothetical protein
MSRNVMADKWGRLANKYGVPAAIALFLVWWLASGVSADIRDLKTALGIHTSETNFYLRQVCLNTSQTENQRAACIALDRR